MKKLISAVMVTAMMLCMSGCFLKKGNQYAYEKKKVFNAAEKVCGASELSEDEKEELLEMTDTIDSLAKYDPEALSEGFCVELNKDDLENLTNADELKEESSLSEMDVDPEQLDNMYTFIKKVDDDMVFSVVMDFEDKDTCEKVFDGVKSTFKKTVTVIQVAGAKEGGIKADSANGKKDYTFVVLQVEENKLMAVYVQYAGDTITMTTYSGAPDTDLLDEFCEFQDEAGFGPVGDMVANL
ncbi:MAG: hypothetical protein IKX04_10705 [Clostridiales bacterium]|nr:hypothetical protein [Clostridiales bacterium]